MRVGCVTIETWATMRRSNGEGMVPAFREAMGLHPDPVVGYYFDDHMRPYLRTSDGRPPELRVGHMSLEAMATGIMGYERFNKYFKQRRPAYTLEDVAPLGPSIFSDINAFVGMVGGLVEVKILEKYQLATQIADQLVDIETSSVMGQRKKIGIGRGGNQARTRKPGEPHPRATLGQKYLTVPDTRELAEGIDLARESVAADMTGDIVQAASDIGEWVGFQRALEIYMVVLGITNPYSFLGTGYNTYQTSSGGATANNNYVNSIANPMTDALTMMQLADKQFALMTAPPPPADHGHRVTIMPDTVLCSSARARRLATMMGLTQLRINDGSSGSGTGVSMYAQMGDGPTIKGLPRNILSSPHVDQLVTASDGLNLSGDTADGLWYYMQKGAFGYSQIFPLQVAAAPADNYIMLDQGLVASYFADERGIPFVNEPRKSLKNTNS